MPRLRNMSICVAGLLIIMSSTGCAMFHDLQPWRLQRWNRGNGMQSGFEAYYSVTDPIESKKGPVFTVPSEPLPPAD